MLSAPGVPAAPGASLGAGIVDPMDSRVGLAPKSRAVCAESPVGWGEHPEMGMFTVEIPWFGHRRGDSITINHPH